MCISYIQRHIRNLPKGQMFTTRTMLIYGKRSAVDSALGRLVASGFIVRKARGVFATEHCPDHTIEAIAEVKSRAFGAKIVKHAETILRELTLISDDPNDPNSSKAVFARDGHSTSFATVHGRVYLKGISPKKMRLRRSPIGRIIYALWYLGAMQVTSFTVRMVCKNFGRREREQLWLASTWMPAWLTEVLSLVFPKPRVVMSHAYLLKS
jgi:hypothetical protein